MSAAPISDGTSERTAIDGSSQIGSSEITPDSSQDAGSSINAKSSKPNDTTGKFDVVQNEKLKRKGDREDGKHELQQEEVWEQLPYAWTPGKKWTVLTVIFVVQCSMNCKCTCRRYREVEAYKDV